MPGLGAAHCATVAAFTRATDESILATLYRAGAPIPAALMARVLGVDRP